MDAAPLRDRASGNLWQADDEDSGPRHGDHTVRDTLHPRRGLDEAAQSPRQAPLGRCRRVYAPRLRKERRASRSSLARGTYALQGGGGVASRRSMTGGSGDSVPSAMRFRVLRRSRESRCLVGRGRPLHDSQRSRLRQCHHHPVALMSSSPTRRSGNNTPVEAAAAGAKAIGMPSTPGWNRPHHPHTGQRREVPLVHRHRARYRATLISAAGPSDTQFAIDLLSV